jgi:LPS-assembly protein
LSDIVGRTDLRIKDIIQFTHRYRLDKDNFVLRRNEIDATIGDHRTYAEVGYLRLNRNIPATFEDLRDREELRAAARIGFARYFSIFASGVVNLTTKADDPDLWFGRLPDAAPPPGPGLYRRLLRPVDHLEARLRDDR